jgi:hypothetical protein
MRYKNKLTEGSAEKVNRTDLNAKCCNYKYFWMLLPLCTVQKYILIHSKKSFCSKIDFSGILDCDTLSVVSSVMIDSLRNVLLYGVRVFPSKAGTYKSGASEKCEVRYSTVSLLSLSTYVRLGQKDLAYCSEVSVTKIF